MNLWIFNHYAITPDLPGGTRHYGLAQELAICGHHVAFFSSLIYSSPNCTEKEEK